MKMKKKTILCALFLSALAQAAVYADEVSTGAAVGFVSDGSREVVYASSLEEVENCVYTSKYKRSNLEIHLNDGIYYLTDDDSDDNAEFSFNKLHNVAFVGSGNTEILMTGEAGSFFSDCDGIIFANLKIGHETKSEYANPILEFENCKNIQIYDCEIFGSEFGICESNGFLLNDGIFLIQNTVIRDCESPLQSNCKATMINCTVNGDSNWAAGQGEAVSTGTEEGAADSAAGSDADWRVEVAEEYFPGAEGDFDISSIFEASYFTYLGGEERFCFWEKTDDGFFIENSFLGKGPEPASIYKGNGIFVVNENLRYVFSPDCNTMILEYKPENLAIKFVRK